MARSQWRLIPGEFSIWRAVAMVIVIGLIDLVLIGVFLKSKSPPVADTCWTDSSTCGKVSLGPITAHQFETHQWH